MLSNIIDIIIVVTSTTNKFISLELKSLLTVPINKLNLIWANNDGQFIAVYLKIWAKLK